MIGLGFVCMYYATWMVNLSIHLGKYVNVNLLVKLTCRTGNLCKLS